MSGTRPDPLKILPYVQVRDSIHTGYIAMVEGLGMIAQIIQRVQEPKSPYTHLAVCGWEAEGRVLMAAESTTPESRVVTLSSILRNAPGRVDIYRLRPEIDRLVDHAALWEWLLRGTGVNYPEMVLYHDWKVLMGLDGRHIPNSDDPQTRRVCSQFVHAGLRVNGMPPMVEHDCDAYPATIADRQFSEYLGTPIIEEHDDV